MATLESTSPDAPAAAAHERSLDPQDWPAMRALGHRMVDDVMTYLEGVAERPVWQKPTDAALASYRAALPRSATAAEEVYDEYLEHVLPYVLGNGHPRFWGWVTGTGTPLGALADLLASATNVHSAFGDQAATHIERQVIGWFAELFDLPTTAGGLLVSSGSTANLTGLTAARDAMVPELLDEGTSSGGAPCVVYASEQVHNSVDKAVGIIGLGRKNLRRIETDAEYRIVPEALEHAIAEDRAAGRRPICIVATVATVNTGAVDDLEALARIARREGLWLHVDGAFGASLIVSPRFKHLLRGIEHADSIAFDFHKWFYVPYDVGCVVVRDESRLRASFSPPASYLAKLDRGIAGGGVSYGGLGADLSRRFRALKVWMSLKEHGADRYGEQIEQNIDQARYLAALIEREPELELAAPVPLNVVCFRYVGRNGAAVADSDATNREILMRLQERGIAAPSSTVLEGRFAIRAAITNHRSTRADFDALVSAVVSIGRELTPGP